MDKKYFNKFFKIDRSTEVSACFLIISALKHNTTNIDVRQMKRVVQTPECYWLDYGTQKEQHILTEKQLENLWAVVTKRGLDGE